MEIGANEVVKENERRMAERFFKETLENHNFTTHLPMPTPTVQERERERKRDREREREKVR